MPQTIPLLTLTLVCRLYVESTVGILLNEQLVIAKNLGHKPYPNALDSWIQTLDNEVGGSSLKFSKMWERDFIFI